MSETAPDLGQTEAEFVLSVAMRYALPEVIAAKVLSSDRAKQFSLAWVEWGKEWSIVSGEAWGAKMSESDRHKLSHDWHGKFHHRIAKLLSQLLHDEWEEHHGGT